MLDVIEAGHAYAHTSGFRLTCAEASAFGTKGAPNDDTTADEAAVRNAQDLRRSPLDRTKSGR
jgi:hypothetical protein